MMMPSRSLCLLSVCLFIGICSTVGSRKMMSDEDRLFDELFKKRHYNRYSRPVANANESVSVVMAISVIRIVEVNEQSEILRTNMWLKLDWSDPRLTWEPSDYGGLEKISLPSVLLWLPDIVLFDSSENGVSIGEGTYNLVVRATGSVDWTPKAIFATYCHINIALFPFDEQTCSLRFESFSYDSAKLNLTLREGQPLILDYYKNNSEWDLVGTSAQRLLVKYLSSEMPTTVLEFGLHIRRRVLYYGYNLILPCTLISILAACSYILPPDSGERIGLGITTLLALTVNQLVVADRVPPTSDALPLLGLYFGSVMIMNTLSVISMVFVSNMYNRSPIIYTMSPSMKHLICNRLGHLLRLRRFPTLDGNNSSSRGAEDNKQCDTTVDQEKSDTKHNVRLSIDGSNANCSHHQRQHQPHPSLDGDSDDWKYAALVIDRLCFCICAIYLTIVTVVFYMYAITSRIY